MSNPSLPEVALRGGFVLLMLLLAPVVWRGSALAAARLAAALALGSAAYAVQTLLLATGPLAAWQAPLQAVASGNPIVLMLLSWALFDDGFRLRSAHGVLWLGWVLLSIGNCYLWRVPLLGLALELAPMGWALAALWPVLRFWRDDLDEQRLRLRGRIVATVVGYTLLSSAMGLPTAGAGAPVWLRMVDSALLAAIGLGAAWSLLVLDRDGLLATSAQAPTRAPVPAFPALGATTVSAGEPAGAVAFHPARSPSRPVPSDGPPAMSAEEWPVPGAASAPSAPVADATGPADDTANTLALQRLQRALAERAPWRREGLTIGRLADDLGLPEYRLRRVIHHQLGHRNFNAFLNAYRIAQAKAALADAAQSGTPVLTIALDAGFQSLGPFNRASKADTGLTPTEFRRQSTAGPPRPADTSVDGLDASGSPNPAIGG